MNKNNEPVDTMTKFVTADTINWNGKTYKAQPAPTEYIRCIGCAFRLNGWCQQPTLLRKYTCLPTLRTDLKDIIWVEGN